MKWFCKHKWQLISVDPMVYTDQEFSGDTLVGYATFFLIVCSKCGKEKTHKISRSITKLDNILNFAKLKRWDTTNWIPNLKT